MSDKDEKKKNDGKAKDPWAKAQEDIPRHDKSVEKRDRAGKYPGNKNKDKGNKGGKGK